MAQSANGLAGWAAASGLAFAALPAAAQPPEPEGAQFQINTYTTSTQVASAVAAAANGDFVVVWESLGSPGTDTSGSSVQGQRYASDGSALGTQFQINTWTTSSQREPAVAAAPDGDFLVVWESNGSSGTDTSFASVQGQRYASNGSAQGAQFQVNTWTTYEQIQPTVAAAADGDFVVVWDSLGPPPAENDIHGQRYASDGSTLGTEFQVNTYTTYEQIAPTVAAAADGDFVVVWMSYGAVSTPSWWSTQAQRYASDGSAQGAEFTVSDFAYGSSVAAAPSGDFVVVWNSYHDETSPGTDMQGYSIRGRRYASNGSGQGTEFQVNTYTTRDQRFPDVAAAANGDFAVVWRSEGSSGTDTHGDSVQGQRYASDGSALGGEFQINTYTTSSQREPAVAAAPDGDFVVVWESFGSSGTDTSGLSIQGQRYGVAAKVPALSPGAAAAAALLLVLAAAVALRRRA